MLGICDKQKLFQYMYSKGDTLGFVAKFSVHYRFILMC
jgi:hypothetical protein